MSEKQKGISLRKKRTKKKDAPTISAPRQISAPMPMNAAGTGAAPQSSSVRPSMDSSRSRSKGPGPDGPQQRQRADKTADLVKRRYSQKIMQLPSDFPGGGAPMPDLPQIPSQFRDKSQTRDGRPDQSADGRGLKVDMRALRDPNLHHGFLIELLVARHVTIHSLAPQQLKLEDVFLRLTKGIVQ